MNRFKLAWKVLCQLGPLRLAENAAYRLGLALDLWKTPLPVEGSTPLDLSALPAGGNFSLDEARRADLLRAAGEIVSGQFRPFGGALAPLGWDHPAPLRPWRDYELGRAAWAGEDIKFTWEPARFGWAIALARAYRVGGDETFPAAFWSHLEAFWDANPPYQGPNWTSGQEVALRLVAWAFVLPALVGSPHSTPARLARLAQSVGEHAARIPPTLLYARSQDNNHLLSEAAGLYTAAALLPAHPAAPRWRQLGWAWFNRAVQRQFAPDGTYIQESLNYHRLALQLATWVDALARRQGQDWPALSRQRLSAATRWLLARLDPASGAAPNFGHNDGAYLFPFGPFGDQRPAVQAAAWAFLGAPALPPGPWDECSQWLGLTPPSKDAPAAPSGSPAESAFSSSPGAGIYSDSSGVILKSADSWAALRVTRFHHRPGQADQFHLDLWHAGQAITLDPGTCSYNAAPPWDNPLAGAAVHNTVTVDESEPMTRAGRFLWLDWDQAEWVSLAPGRVVARRMGYCRRGVLHSRSLECPAPDQWRVIDDLLPLDPAPRHHTIALHWLFPAGPWEWHGETLRLPDLGVEVTLRAVGPSAPRPQFQLICAGELLYGEGPVSPVLGWFSPTYAVRLPALTLRVVLSADVLPVRFETSFRLHHLLQRSP